MSSHSNSNADDDHVKRNRDDGHSHVKDNVVCTVLGNEEHKGCEESDRVQNASIRDYSQSGPDNTCLWGERRNLAGCFPDTVCQQSCAENVG